MNLIRDIHVPPMSARALAVAKGQTLRIVDVEGRQPGDLVAFMTGDPSVRFCQARTRVENRRCWVTRGHSLWTGEPLPRVMFTITGDTGGRHDLLYTPCCRYALEKRYGVRRDGCHENLVRALEDFGFPVREIPPPLNLFFPVSVDSAGLMRIEAPNSADGAAIELRAEMDVVVAVSTCSVPMPGKDNSAYRIEIFET